MKKNQKVKVKTKKSVSRRIKVTSTGKLMHRSNFKGHLRRNKSSKRKRNFKIEKVFSKGKGKKIAKALMLK